MKKTRQMITDKQGYEWLEYQLNKAGGSLMRSNIGKLLKTRLSNMGYWKNKARGDGGKVLK